MFKNEIGPGVVPVQRSTNKHEPYKNIPKAQTTCNWLSVDSVRGYMKFLQIICLFTANERQPWTDSHDYYFEYLIIHFDYLIIQFDYLIIG